MYPKTPEITYVKELSRLLNLKDLRSVKRWCRMNGVTILKDHGCRSSYVMRSDYESARMRAFIQILKNRHGNNWRVMYEAHLAFNLDLLTEASADKRMDQHTQGNHLISFSETSPRVSKFHARLLKVLEFTSEK
jgi:hypothetical protein